MTSDPTPSDYEKADRGLKDLIEYLEHAGLDMSQKEGSDDFEVEGPEETRRGMPPPAMMMLNLQLGCRIKFDDVMEMNGQPVTKTIDGFVTGVFLDGFAFLPLRRKTR